MASCVQLHQAPGWAGVFPDLPHLRARPLPALASICWQTGTCKPGEVAWWHHPLVQCDNLSAFCTHPPCEQGTKLSFEQSKMGCGRAERRGGMPPVWGKASVKVWRLRSECFSHLLCTVCLLLLKCFRGRGQKSTHPSAMTMCARPLLCPETVGTRRTQTPVIGDGRERMC